MLASPDIVLAADCVYFEPAFPLLHQTLRNLTENRNVQVYMAYKKRRKVSRIVLLMAGGQTLLHEHQKGFQYR
jgi:hypothetical protein